MTLIGRGAYAIGRYIYIGVVMALLESSPALGETLLSILGAGIAIVGCLRFYDRASPELIEWVKSTYSEVENRMGRDRTLVATSVIGGFTLGAVYAGGLMTAIDFFIFLFLVVSLAAAVVYEVVFAISTGVHRLKH